MKVKLLIFISFLLLYLLLMGGHIYSPDEELMFRTTQSLVERQSLVIDPLPTTFGTRTGINGKEYAQYGVGQPILAMPFYFAGKIAVDFLPDSVKEIFTINTTQYHSQTEDDYVLRFAVSLFNQFITSCTCVVLFSFLFLVTKDKKASVRVTVLYGLSTIALVHSKTFFSEPLTALLFLLTFWAIKKSTTTDLNRYLILAGIFSGYSILTRLDSIVSLPPLFIFLILEIYFSYKECIKRNPTFSELLDHYFNPVIFLKILVFIIPIVLQICLMLFLNKLRYGSFLSTGYEDQTEGVKFSNPLIDGLYGYLFSIGKGLFFFSPPLILYFASIKKFFKDHISEAISTSVLIFIYLIFYSMWQNWDGGWCWGPRHIFIIHAFLAIPIVSFLKGKLSRTREIIVSVLLVIGFAVQIYGASENFIDFYVDYYRSHSIEISKVKGEKNLEEYRLYYYDTAPEISKYYSVYPFPAPPYHSLYVLYHSQWIGYLDMMKRGKHDFFVLHIINKFSKKIN